MRQSKIKSLFLLISIIFCQNVFGQYIPYCQKGKWGFAMINGKIIIPCVYEEAYPYSSDNIAKVKKAGKYGYINKKGEPVIPLKYDDCVRIYETYRGESNIGIKRNVQFHLGSDFDFKDIKNNQYIVFQNNKYGVISLIKGVPKVSIPSNYSRIQFDIDRKIFRCTDNEGILYFNMAGQKLTPIQMSSIELPEPPTQAGRGKSDEHPVVVSLNGKVGAIQRRRYSSEQDTIVPIIYDDIIIDKFNDDYSQYDGIFGVKDGKNWGILGSKKNILLPIQYDSVNFELSKKSTHWFVYPRIIVAKKNNKWGIVGKKNDDTDIVTTLLPFSYEVISLMQYKYLLLQKEGRFCIYGIEKASLINNKNYSSLTKYEYESIDGFEVFQVVNKLGQIVYIGENGVDFFTD